MTIKAIVFDYGKVLTYPQSEQHIAEMAGLLNISTEKFDEVYYHFRDLYDSGKIDGRGYWKKVADYLRLSEPEEKILEQLIFNDLSSWFVQNREMWELVYKLRQEYRTALLSNNIHELVAKMEKELELEKYFDEIIFSNRLSFIKPDPRIYRYCLEKLNLLPEEMVFIDDKNVNIEAASKIGIKGILFTGYKSLIKELSLILGESYEKGRTEKI